MKLCSLRKERKRNCLVRTCVVKSVVHQRKGDCIRACWSVTPTGQVHLWSVILGKHTEIDQCLHVILKSAYTHIHPHTYIHIQPHTHVYQITYVHTYTHTPNHTHPITHTHTHTHTHNRMQLHKMNQQMSPPLISTGEPLPLPTQLPSTSNCHWRLSFGRPSTQSIA